MPNLTKLVEISANETEKYHLLSPETVNLCLSLLARYAIPGYWFAWSNNKAISLTDEEQDQSEAIAALATEELLTEAQTMYIGEIRMFAGSVPDKWLVCDGAELSRTTYALLFAEIGTTWGNQGATTFTLPDFRGRAPQGADYPNNEIPGMTVGVKIQTQVPSHKHTIYRESATKTYRGLSSTLMGINTEDTSLTGVVGGIDQRGPRLPIFLAIYAGV